MKLSSTFLLSSWKKARKLGSRAPQMSKAVFLFNKSRFRAYYLTSAQTRQVPFHVVTLFYDIESTTIIKFQRNRPSRNRLAAN